jgi:hypothetical protein
LASRTSTRSRRKLLLYVRCDVLPDFVVERRQTVIGAYWGWANTRHSYGLCLALFVPVPAQLMVGGCAAHCASFLFGMCCSITVPHASLENPSQVSTLVLAPLIPNERYSRNTTLIYLYSILEINDFLSNNRRTVWFLARSSTVSYRVRHKSLAC